MAYAALVSLVNILEQYLELNLIPQNNGYVQTLLQESGLFQDFLEKSSQKNSEKVKCLESRIRDVAYKAQDIVDSNVADRLDESVFCLASLFDECSEVDLMNQWLFHDLDEVMEEIDSIKQEVMQIEEKEEEEDDNNDESKHQPRILPPADSSRPPSDGMTTTVGLDDDLKQIKTRLFSGSLQLEIVALVGMGGIGKTTLARKVYNDRSIGSHFDTCRWVTVSQEYGIHNILARLLGDDKMSQENNENLRLNLYQSLKVLGDDKMSQEEKLRLNLYQSLKNRRYLIVLDDVWDTQVWDYLKRVLPNDMNGSRLLLTTRLEQVAKYENSCPPKHMRLLNHEESWVLFCEKVFGRDCCPLHHEEVGKEIVENCRGLPLAIKVISGHLSKATRTEHYWKSVAKNLSETIALEDDEQCSTVFSLSYTHLPHHLKGCFLYMSIFKEDYEIEVSQLIHLWIASGLIKKERSKSFKDVAMEYFLDFVERNLVLVSKIRYNGKIKSCKIHDLIRDLCVKEVKHEKFFHMTDKTCYSSQDQVDVAQHSRLLRAYIHDEKYNEFRIMVNHQLNLRYLHVINFGYWNAASLHKLQCLHTIYCHLSFVETLDIWKMPQLRHVQIRDSLFLEDPPKIKSEGPVIVLEKLETLATLMNLIITDDVLRRIPNIKKLGVTYIERRDTIRIDWRGFGLNNLEHLYKLESLNSDFDLSPVLLKRDITFPPGIKKLSLANCHCSWEDITVVGSLPNLEVLRLKLSSFVGKEWKPNEGEFLNLKTLFLECLDLMHWRAEANHLPRLQHLLIQFCEELQEIPRDIGEIATLQLIQLYAVGESVLSSAREIKEEQHNYGNEDFQVVTGFFE